MVHALDNQVIYSRINVFLSHFRNQNNSIYLLFIPKALESMDLVKNSLLRPDIEVDVPSALPRIFYGPRSLISYTILQGFFTVLIIKELVSISRCVVKGSRRNLNVNDILLWNLVEDCEDLYKLFAKNFFQPRRTHGFSAQHYPKVRRLNSTGRQRLALAAVIALFIFAADMVLVICSVPNRMSQNSGDMKKISWANSGSIIDVTAENILRGSFSRIIKLNAPDDDIEFNRLPSISVDRTDFRDFLAVLPLYDGTLIKCSTEQGWRFLCQIHCENTFYQYKVRIDVSTDSSSSYFFVGTSQFNFSESRIREYADKIKIQLNIEYTRITINSTQTAFIIHTAITDFPPERTLIPKSILTTSGIAKVDVLTHDAIATIFLGSIVIDSAPINSTYYIRKCTERKEDVGIINGTIAISQRPLLPLLGTIIMYVVFQVFSIVLQTTFGLHTLNPEVGILLEVTGGLCTENWANAKVGELKLVYSKSTKKETSDTFGHFGYLPAKIITQIRHYIHPKYDKELERDEEFNLISRYQLNKIPHIGDVKSIVEDYNSV